ncbi:hypothetical protein GEV39_06005 [Pseudomonas sp. NY5710]|nr:hypothetical protein DMX12_13355 [Pseudomonas sp. MB-090624]QKL00994.1 hypothetical protein GEV39_06005 [Pseudomonas sp. NY5710]
MGWTIQATCTGPIAGKPAPTGPGNCAGLVGAGLPAMRPAQAVGISSCSLELDAVQLPQQQRIRKRPHQRHRANEPERHGE